MKTVFTNIIMTSSFTTLSVSDKIFFSKWGPNGTSDDIFLKLQLFDRVDEQTLVRFLSNNVYIQRDLEVGGTLLTNALTVDSILFRTGAFTTETQSRAFLDSYYDTIVSCQTLLSRLDLATANTIKFQSNVDLVFQGTGKINQSSSTGWNTFNSSYIKSGQQISLLENAFISQSEFTSGSSKNFFAKSLFMGDIELGISGKIFQNLTLATNIMNHITLNSAANITFAGTGKIIQSSSTGTNLMSPITMNASAIFSTPSDITFTSAGKIDQTNTTGTNVMGQITMKSTGIINTPTDIIFTSDGKINQNGTTGVNTLSATDFKSAANVNMSGQLTCNGDKTKGVRLTGGSLITQQNTGMGTWTVNVTNNLGPTIFTNPDTTPGPNFSLQVVSNNGYGFALGPYLNNGNFNPFVQTKDNVIFSSNSSANGMVMTNNLAGWGAHGIRTSAFLLFDATTYAASVSMVNRTKGIWMYSQSPATIIDGDIVHRPANIGFQTDASLALSGGFTSSLAYGSLSYDDTNSTYWIANRKTAGKVGFQFTTNNGTTMITGVEADIDKVCFKNKTNTGNQLCIKPGATVSTIAPITLLATNTSSITSNLKIVCTHSIDGDQLVTNFTPSGIFHDKQVVYNILPSQITSPQACGWNYQKNILLTTSVNGGINPADPVGVTLSPGSYIGTIWFRKQIGGGATISSFKLGLSEITSGLSSYLDTGDNRGLAYSSYCEDDVVLSSTNFFRRSGSTPFQLNVTTTIYPVYEVAWTGAWLGDGSIGVSIVKIA